ncbi:PhzF family phenazine biosynthesis isomerase [Streptomyces ureilyticus]|uniref:PhzF family phenazine biosynthesis protein n=1 Tax=Streptomyces ureilyticus TaxID=1775131 RepID=A0ABX0E7L3_9ACTN|nr:PhzF family phenazine biosynthesis isomerase [Streptomyces ureilyticus]NGO48728.1 PhzF family phenazine biosynthesis protein [Streptomyces ureilyticus]
MRPETSTAVLRYSAFTPEGSGGDGGNPAGIVLDAAGLDPDRMLALAAEVGYSETAFVTARDDAGRRFRVRYFSPLVEVPFCGHATVATAVALAERNGPGEFVFDTPAGEIPVSTAADPDGTLRATLTSVPTRSRPATPDEAAEALAALRWAETDLDPELPPHVAFGGAEHLVLAVASRARLADLSYDFDGLADLMRQHGWTTLQLVWRAADDLFHARDPFPVGGVVEDPATGAAAAAFGGYLRTLGLVREPMTLTVRQGEDMGRPSELLVDIDPTDPRVRVTGRARPIR